MIGMIVDTVVSVVLVVGLPAVVIAFFLKGALVGKPLPSTVILPAYLLAISADTNEILGVVGVSSVSYLVGQLVVYYGARRGGVSYINSSPRLSIRGDQLRRVEAWFHRYGGMTIILSGVIPYIRGFCMIPAGASSYPVGRLAVFVWVSTYLYHLVIVGLAVGFVQLVV